MAEQEGKAETSSQKHIKKENTTKPETELNTTEQATYT